MDLLPEQFCFRIRLIRSCLGYSPEQFCASSAPIRSSIEASPVNFGVVHSQTFAFPAFSAFRVLSAFHAFQVFRALSAFRARYLSCGF